MNTLKRLALAACILLATFSPALKAQEADDAPRSRWWGGLGLGYGYIDANAQPAPSGESGVWVQLQGGVRIGEHWLVGLEFGGVGVEIGENNYDPNDRYSSVYGQSITHAALLVQYAPLSDRGWLFSAGAGESFYDNRVLRELTHEDTNGTGWAGLVRASYDWRLGMSGVYGIDLSYEQGDVELKSPFDGKFDYSMVTLGFHYTYR